MSRRRRAVLLLGLSLVLGGLAASDVASREATVRRRAGPPVAVVVARTDLPAGSRLTASRLGQRRIPASYLPAGVSGSPGELVGARTAVPVRAGAFLSVDDLDRGNQPSAGRSANVGPGERAIDVVAVGSAELVQAGGRVDVLVTSDSRHGAPGRTTLALEDVEVLAVAPAGAATGGRGSQDAAPRIALSLRVTLRQAVYLAAAQSFARELRILPRGPDDRRHGSAGLAVGSDLR